MHEHKAGDDRCADPIEIRGDAERMSVTRPTRCVSWMVLLTLLDLTFRRVVVRLDIEEAVHPGGILARMRERLGRLVRSDGRAAELPHDGSQQRDDPEEASVRAHRGYLGTNPLKRKFTHRDQPSHERKSSLIGIQSPIAIITRFSVRLTNPSGTLDPPPTQAHFSSRFFT